MIMCVQVCKSLSVICVSVCERVYVRVCVCVPWTSLWSGYHGLDKTKTSQNMVPASATSNAHGCASAFPASKEQE